MWIDLKVIRLPGEQLSYTSDLTATNELKTIEGVVINTLEAYSTPQSYVVETKDGHQVTISSNRYNHTFLSMAGSKIEVTGSKTNKPNHLLATDPKLHQVRHLR